ncbi:MAG: hypothetical protein CMO55_16935 [Verrucomicrobiales bacterium]|nr:hypothetical protein [Verrucomicrobiales bacterium]
MSEFKSNFLSDFVSVSDDRKFFSASSGGETRIDFQKRDGSRISLPYYSSQEIVYDQYIDEDGNTDGEFISINFPGTGKVSIFGEKLTAVYEGFNRQVIYCLREASDGESEDSDGLFVESLLVELEGHQTTDQEWETGEELEGDAFEEKENDES